MDLKEMLNRSRVSRHERAARKWDRMAAGEQSAGRPEKAAEYRKTAQELRDSDPQKVK